MSEIFYNDARLSAIKKAVVDGLALYGLSPETRWHLVNLSENATFFIECNPPLGLRVYRQNYHTDEEILSELTFMDGLARDTKLCLAKIKPNQAGAWLSHVGGYRLAAFHWIFGKTASSATPQAWHFYKLGQISAQLHHYSRAWPKPEWFRRKLWCFETMIGAKAYWGDWRHSELLSQTDQTLIEASLKKVQQRSQNWGKSEGQYGLIHADLRLANLIIHRQNLAIIDFDDCGYSWFAMELANALSFIEHEPQLESWVAQWAKGYQTISALPYGFYHMLPDLILMRRLQLWAWLSSHSEAECAIDRAQFLAQTLALHQKWRQGSLINRG